MCKTLVCSLAVALLAALVCPAAGQVVDPQPRPMSAIFGPQRPLDPNRTSQQLTLTLDLGGGYDRNVGAEGEPLPAQVFSPADSGYSGTAAANLRYWHGRPVRFIELRGRGYANPHVGLDPLVGGSAGLRSATSLGRRMGATATADVSYAPTFLYSGFGPLLPPGVEISIPDASSPQGVIEERWLSAQGTAGWFRHWTPRQRFDVEYSRGLRRPTSSGPGFDSEAQAVSARHTWAPHERAAYLFSYRFDENRQADALGDRPPLRQHTGDAGVRFERRLSPSRGFVLSMSGAASYARLQDRAGRELREFIVPGGTVLGRFDVARNWSLTTDASRTVTVLDGFAPEPFTTDALATRLAGVIGRRTNVAGHLAYSRGTGVLSDEGAFRSTTGTAQVQWAVASCCALFTTYSYYHHALENVPELAAGFPVEYTRHSGRIGLIVLLPLFGSY